MYFYKVLVGLFLYVISTVSFAHVAGVTDTGISINADSINLVYTLPSDNINEFTDLQKIQLEQTIIQGFSVTNKVDDKPQACDGQLISTNKLENILSEQFHILYRCNEPLEDISISYSLLFSKDREHKNHVRLSIAGRSKSYIYTATNSTHLVPVKKLLARWGLALNPYKKAQSTNVTTQSQNSVSELLLQSTHYVMIGVEHILLGYDHVLFLIGLLLLPLSFRSIVIIATSFTLAHSVTLALSVLDIFTLPAPYVEAVIALSIVYVAIENIRVLKQKNSTSSTNNIALAPWQRRTAITFLFGLLHGFGFSYVLKEIGLGDHIVGSLLFFNVGVEIGQLAIIALCFPLLWYAFRKAWGAKLAITLSILVGLMGLFWLIERVYSLV